MDHPHWLTQRIRCLPRSFTLLCTLAVAAGCSSTPDHRPVSRAGERQPVQRDPVIGTDLDGQAHDLDAILDAGQNLVLIFWQEWCRDCVIEMPRLIEAWNTMGTDHTFYGVIAGPDSSIDEGALRLMIDQLQIPWPQLRDPDWSLSVLAGVGGSPELVIFAPGWERLFHGNRLPE